MWSPGDPTPARPGEVVTPCGARRLCSGMCGSHWSTFAYCKQNISFACRPRSSCACSGRLRRPRPCASRSLGRGSRTAAGCIFRHRTSIRSRNGRPGRWVAGDDVRRPQCVVLRGPKESGAGRQVLGAHKIRPRHADPLIHGHDLIQARHRKLPAHVVEALDVSRRVD